MEQIKIAAACGLAFSTLVVRGLMPNFKALQKEQTEIFGKLKFWHTRVVAHSESIAFFGGVSGLERSKIL